jgi:hypothetical protein
MTNLHRSPPMNQSETDLGIVNESQLLRFGISSNFVAHILSTRLPRDRDLEIAADAYHVEET